MTKETYEDRKIQEGEIEAETRKQQLDDDGFPLCPKYKAKVLPDENGMCSLCGEHKK